MVYGIYLGLKLVPMFLLVGPRMSYIGTWTHWVKTLVPKAIKGMVFGIRVLKYWLLGLSGRLFRCIITFPEGPNVQTCLFQMSSATPVGYVDPQGISLGIGSTQTLFSTMTIRETQLPSISKTDKLRVASTQHLEFLVQKTIPLIVIRTIGTLYIGYLNP